MSGCTWEPIARPPLPERLFEGPARVERTIDDGRYAIVFTGLAADQRARLVETKSLTWCELPAGSTPFQSVLTAPNLKVKNAPAFLLPVVREDETGKQLYFSDQKCALVGPFGPSEGSLELLTLKADTRQVGLYLDATGKLLLIDPWQAETRVVSQQASGFWFVDQRDGPTTPQALWVMEAGKLTQRALDGTLLLQLGSNVTEFGQTLLQDGLRVAFVDGGELFEAKSPDFTPVLIAEDACGVAYGAATLDFLLPCGERQLVRVDLATGKIRRFTAGVARSFSIGPVEIEEVAGRLGGELWANVGEGALRAQLIPSPSRRISALDRERITGVTQDGRFGVWSLSKGFVPVLDDVTDLIIYRVTRTNRFLWVTTHDVKDGVGRLSVFDQAALETFLATTTLAGPPIALQLTTLAEGMPSDNNGFRLATVAAQPEPVVGALSNAYKLSTVEAFAGTFTVSLLSGDLSSQVDEGVSSFQLITAPDATPAVLYGIVEGERAGLWFAAL